MTQGATPEDVMVHFLRKNGHARDSAESTARGLLSALTAAGYPVESLPAMREALEKMQMLLCDVSEERLERSGIDRGQALTMLEDALIKQEPKP